MLDTLNECLKQLQPARSHNVDTQLGMFRSIKPSTLSGWLISSDHMITTLSQFPVLLVFVQPQPAGCSFCSLQHCSSVLFPTMPKELNVIHTGKLRQPTSTGNSQGAIHTLYRVCGSVYLAVFISYARLLPRYCQCNNDKGAWQPLTGLRCPV